MHSPYKTILTIFFFFIFITVTIQAQDLTARQKLLLEGARSRLGDIYDSGYYSSGYPPAGKSACVDILVFACQKADIDLKKSVNDYISLYPHKFPEARRDRAIDHRWVPNLFVYFSNKNHAQSLTIETDPAAIAQWQPGDFVFWSLTGDGITDHCGVISNKKSKDGKRPLVIHQFPPKCK